MKDILLKEIKKNIPLTDFDEELKIETPPKSEMGDFAFCCFPLAGKLKKDPKEIALEIKENISLPEFISEVQVLGAYVNFFLDKKIAFEKLITDIGKEDYFKNESLSGKKMMVEYLSPNTNKPLHLGHLRNGILGTSVSNLLECCGAEVLKANNINDRGVHIIKSMLAYKLWGEEKEPDKKGDHFVGDFYIKYSQNETEELKERVQLMLKKWEEGDPEVVFLWEKMNNWVYEGFKETNDRLGFSFDRTYYESETYKLGREVIKEKAEEGIGEEKEDGSVVIDMSDVDLNGGKNNEIPVLLLRPNGTSLYITQDVGLAVKRFKEEKLDAITYVVAREQEFHFKKVFELLKRYGYDNKSLYHLSYGMVNLTTGRMKSREGTVVDADNLLNDLSEMVLKQSKEDLRESQTEKIVLGALKFYLSSVSPNKDMTFNPEESIKFEGYTGPYIQYACTRVLAIEKKSKGLESYKKEGIEKEEFELVKLLLKFPEIIQQSAHHYNPSILADFLYETAKSFSVFYDNYPVIKGEKYDFNRMKLCQATRSVLSEGLEILGILVPEKM